MLLGVFWFNRIDTGFQSAESHFDRSSGLACKIRHVNGVEQMTRTRTSLRADVKQRAIAARLQATARKAWEANVKAAAAGSLWRVTSAWIEQRCGTRCADLTHVSTGKTRTIRCMASESIDACRAAIGGD
jgi:hypothetical protein